MQTTQKCWWCGSTKNLTGEHKIKKTHFDYFYNKSEYKELGLKLFKSREDGSIIIQGPKSDFIKFPKFLCNVCNGHKSKLFDDSYDMFFTYYFDNEIKILAEKTVDLCDIYQNQWEEKWILFKKYIVKHISCRLVEKGFKPTHNMINFLNGIDDLFDVKIVLTLKPYAEQLTLNFPPLSIGRLFTHENMIKNELEFSGWFTIKSLSVEYLVQKNINQKSISSNSLIKLNKTDYSSFSSVSITKENIINWQYILEDYQFGSDSMWFHYYMRNMKSV
ncbi:hypothetical protein EI427_19560 [Flammeovirga pectinis]|uniref:HNH endonuclease n=1 Tax=Flammeovirga pectinis TaxID=2494373 RepID=A0A3Q9FTL4_9BACT|nr:hypothetical protein [Flammeovirga pectinis]AZQ64329.1 hypothetical protein EI427_19560 [Flammeovirga pectinis]